MLPIWPWLRRRPASSFRLEKVSILTLVHAIAARITDQDFFEDSHVEEEHHLFMSLDEAMNESRQFDGAFVQDFDASNGTMLLVIHNPEFYAAVAASWSLSFVHFTVVY